MKSIWGKGKKFDYSEKTLDLFYSMVRDTRKEFKKEFESALSRHNFSMMYEGVRFKSDEDILLVLESNVPETDFIQEPKHFLFAVLMGASEADYYYSFEKRWD